jgi:hypothetical protein
MRWVRSIKEECSSKLILFGENSLRRVLSEFLEHYHHERNHQGTDNVCSSLPLFHLSPVADLESTVENASADYFGTTAAPHEYFDQTP